MEDAPEHRQYIAVRFKPESPKLYTYHNDGAPVAAGERVVVESFDGKGTTRVDVVNVDLPKPHFKTKPIVSVVGDATEKPKPSPVDELFGGQDSE